MKIHVSSLIKVPMMVADHKPSHVVSLLGSQAEFPEIDGYGADRHHRVTLDDIRKPMAGMVTPGVEHVIALIQFLESWDPQSPLLSHCWAGISRSTATAFIAACLHNPQADEKMIADLIAETSPTAFPNTLIVAHADDLMGRGGRMVKAVEAICSDEDRITRLHNLEEALPFSIPSKF